MTDTLENLRRKIDGATELGSVVRTMKAVAASSIGQYENAVLALDDYYRTVELGLSVIFRQRNREPEDSAEQKKGREVAAIVFGSDQGLVGQFNDIVADFAAARLKDLPGTKAVWTVGARMQSSLSDSGLPLAGQFDLPTSIAAITPLIGEIVQMIDKDKANIGELYLFHNRAKLEAVYEPVVQRLLPLDAKWERDIAALPWPTKSLPEAVGEIEPALVRSYLFISLFKACAESLASENASRLAAMQRAEKNIGDLLETLNSSFHRLRQSSIDEELFDVITGFEALSRPSN
jgi:F-type H+-transporting ATPase subunit gamma